MVNQWSEHGDKHDMEAEHPQHQTYGWRERGYSRELKITRFDKVKFWGALVILVSFIILSITVDLHLGTLLRGIWIVPISLGVLFAYFKKVHDVKKHEGNIT